MVDRCRIAGVTKRYDGYPAFTGVTDLKKLVRIIEVVIGFERAVHRYLNK
jgi:hypothetical protein